MPTPLLEHHPAPSHHEDPDLLRRKVERLEGELQDAKDALTDERKRSAKAHRAMANLQQALGPFYNALRMIFGEIEDVGVENIPSTAPAGMPPQQDSRVSAVWESWKHKLGGLQAEFITAMQAHGEMSVPQLRVAAHCAQQSVYETIHKLHKLGLVNKNNGKYSLKQL